MNSLLKLIAKYFITYQNSNQRQYSNIANSYSSVVARFEERLYLPSTMKFKLIDIEENNNPELKEKFLSQITGTSQILELYHVCRNDAEANTKSILQKGFYPSYNPYNNKGTGTYFANHGRYSLTWAGQHAPVLVCHVIYNKNDKLVERYKSEIYSPGSASSEYVVKNPLIIYPAYVLRYQIEGGFDRSHNFGYVKHGGFGCFKCDTKNEYGNFKRCDCKYDEIDQSDIIGIVGMH